MRSNCELTRRTSEPLRPALRQPAPPGRRRRGRRACPGLRDRARSDRPDAAARVPSRLRRRRVRRGNHDVARGVPRGDVLDLAAGGGGRPRRPGEVRRRGRPGPARVLPAARSECGRGRARDTPAGGGDARPRRGRRARGGQGRRAASQRGSVRAAGYRPRGRAPSQRAAGVAAASAPTAAAMAAPDRGAREPACDRRVRAASRHPRRHPRRQHAVGYRGQG